MQKQLIGKFLTFKFVGRKENISGVVLTYNNDWTLVRRCIDYELDGYTVFKNEKVEHYYGDFEKRAARILKLKNYYFKKEPKIPIDSLETILVFAAKKFKLIQLDTRKGDAFDVVSYLKREDSLYQFDELTINAKWRYKLKLPEKECKFISFDNDYLNSIKLITKFK